MAVEKRDPASTPVQAELLHRLLDLARRQKEALQQGRTDLFLDLMAERTRLFETLQAVAGAGRRPFPRRELAGLVEEILRIDGENAVALESLLRDLGIEAGRLARGEAGAIAYLHGAAVGMDHGGPILDGRR